MKFRSLTEHIDTETAAGRAMWQMIGVMAEMERSMIAERTRARVKAAKSRGVKFGRKPTLTPPQITHARQQIDQGRTVKEVAALLNVHRMTIYRALVAPSSGASRFERLWREGGCDHALFSGTVKLWNKHRLN